MSQRESGYVRQARDLYETPDWVTHALCPHVGTLKHIWEPACGSGKMARAIEQRCSVSVSSTDIEPIDNAGDVVDFLTAKTLPNTVTNAIITNPPYEKATEFCEHALALMETVGGKVAMLLRTDFDHAKSRTHLFRDCPAFSKKVVLMRRICWFVEADGKPKASPSFNHAWYVWDWKHEGPPAIAYGP